VALVESIQWICLKYQVACDLVHTQQATIWHSCVIKSFENLGVGTLVGDYLRARTITNLTGVYWTWVTANTCGHNYRKGPCRCVGLPPALVLWKTKFVGNTQKSLLDLKAGPKQLTVGQSTPGLCLNQVALLLCKVFVSMG